MRAESIVELGGAAALVVAVVMSVPMALGRAGPTGACCFPHGCQVMTQEACFGAGGVFMGPFTSCFPSPCPPGPVGACCHLALGTCQVTAEADCFWPDFQYQGHGTSCSPNPCASNGGCPGDLTGDCVVDVFDLLELLAAWGECEPDQPCQADLNGDGVVDVFDLLMLLGHWS